MANGEVDRGRWIEIPPERFTSWICSFGRRHGGVVAAGAGPAAVEFRAADGATAVCHIPFPPLPRDTGPGDGEGGGAAAEARRAAAHAGADRTVGVMLVRLGGYAVGVFRGSPPRLEASKTGARPVHGRSAAGGWSQRRFARRREKQASIALGAAADTAARVFAPYRGLLDAVVLGGDRRAMAGVRADPRLRPYLDIAVERFLTVPEPRLAVLRDAPRRFRALRVWLTEPRPPGDGPAGPGARAR